MQLTHEVDGVGPLTGPLMLLTHIHASRRARAPTPDDHGVSSRTHQPTRDRTAADRPLPPQADHGLRVP